MDIWWRMADNDGNGGADGGESDHRREKRAELEVAMKGNLAVQAYIKMGCTIMVYLAFTWSTVVLLGGYVGSLQRKDFWCLTIITVIEATSIFNELESQDKVKVGISNIRGGILIAAAESFDRLTCRASYLSWLEGGVSLAFAAILARPVLFMFNILLLFNLYGPIACIGLSSWRLRQRDYHVNAGVKDNGELNLMRGLDFFYTLVLCHGVLYSFLLLLLASQSDLVVSFSRHCKFLKAWGWTRIEAYLLDTRERGERDPRVLAAEGTSFLNYLVGLLESESLEDYLTGARLLYVLIDDGEDASSIILRSRSKVQKLLDMLRQPSAGGEKVAEIRLVSARIVADLAAGGMQLSQFPGAIRCVLSLVETSTTGQQQLVLWNKNNKNQQPLWNNSNLSVTERNQLQQQSLEFLKLFCRRKTTSRKQGAGDDGGQVEEKSSSRQRSVVGCNELILQGLRIVEGLAGDANNCREICAAPDLIAKITAPLFSATFIDGIGKSAAWADVAGASLRALHQLIHAAPGRAGRRLRREIASNARAVTNLENILDLEAVEGGAAQAQQLQIPAMEILTELVVAPSVNISRETRENLVRKQVSIFLGLTEGGQDEDVVGPVPTATAIKKKMTAKKPRAINKKEKTIEATAGETLAILSKSELISRFIVREHYDIVDRLTLTAGMIDAKHTTNIIRYRTLSAEILENICTHCKEHVNEALLQKVIEILTKPTKTEASGDNEEIRENSSHGDDVEKQSRPKQTGQGKKATKASDQQADEDDMKELQQALLSLTLVIHETVPLLQESASRDAVVDKLKAIVDDNCQEMTPVSLRIVKLCCQIVTSRNRCTTREQKKEFLESLSKASKAMANLESCMLFAGTDCGMDKIAWPLLSDLEGELNKLAAN
ncbi:uncharacterized protein LOC120681410 [Panicum virgatum]|uniref:Uncharacterized protein n=2 Tax=Panicum virgatum TaxID=38727 RepID=A0A8T0PUB3_PANVG|nr:uncharacterized protein LOC120681410 [Panicum virgatum]KAG2566021.1 hypothetical protein PVAP13_7NG131117 [Panicum virgatum]